MAAYTVTDIFTRVQRIFGDESAVQVAEADILRWINDAQREAVMQHEGLLMTESFITTVAGTAEYSIPTNLFVLNGVSVQDVSTGSYYPIRFAPLQSLNEYAGGWDGSDYPSGRPSVYTKDTNDKIILFPRPDQAISNGIKLTYSRYPVDLTASGDTIDLPQYYLGYVEAFCMMKAYEMDEDWEAAQIKAQLLQSTLDFNNNRESWFGHETYPVITASAEDSW